MKDSQIIVAQRELAARTRVLKKLKRDQRPTGVILVRVIMTTMVKKTLMMGRMVICNFI